MNRIHHMFRKTKFICPKCNVSISDRNLTEKSADEIYVDLDTYHRKKVKEVYSKKEHDFENTEEGKHYGFVSMIVCDYLSYAGYEEYCRYEEMIEDLIYNLNNGINVPETWKEIEDYKLANEQLILESNDRNMIAELTFQNNLVKLENERKRKLQELQELDLLEIKKSKENEKYRNNLMLGDSITNSDIQSSLFAQAVKQETTVPVESKGPSLASIVCFHRPLPMPIQNFTLSINLQDRKHNDTQMHLAGGYDFVEYSRRNWKEIKNGLGQQVLLIEEISILDEYIIADIQSKNDKWIRFEWD